MKLATNIHHVSRNCCDLRRFSTSEISVQGYSEGIFKTTCKTKIFDVLKPQLKLFKNTFRTKTEDYLTEKLKLKLEL